LLQQVPNTFVHVERINCSEYEGSQIIIPFTIEQERLRMNKRWLWILIGVVAFFAMLFSGAVAGAGLTYFALQARPARAALDTIIETVNQTDSDYEEGVLVLHVDQGSTAAVAGIQRGDIILAVDDQPVDSDLELMQAIENKSAGEEVVLTVQHCESTQELTVQLEERNGHIYLGLQFGRSRIIDALPFERRRVEIPFGRYAFVITSVIPDSPASVAGLNPGDIIIAVDDEKVKPGDELANIIHSYQPGEEITLSISQPGTDKVRQVAVTLGENPDNEGLAYLGIKYISMPGFSGEGMGGQFFHFELPKFDGDQYQFPQLPENLMPFFHEFPPLPDGVKGGVVIHTVTEESPAAEAGLEAGDVVTAINGEEISDPESFVETVRSFDPSDEISLTVYRNGEDKALEILVLLGENPVVDGQAYLGVEIGGFFRFEGRGPSLDPQNPFHFKFQFPWQEGNWPENHNEPGPGEEA
jgi:S1-C subfamily serine protease